MTADDSDLNDALGKRIRARRRLLGLSQVNIADQLGFSHQQLQKYESGKNNISVNLLDNISRVLHSHASELLMHAEDDTQAQTKKDGAKNSRQGEQSNQLIQNIGSIGDAAIRRNLLKLLEAIQSASVNVEECAD